METVVFTCEDSIEGILTGVYDAWAEAVSSKLGHGHCKLAVQRERRSLGVGVEDERGDRETEYFEQQELFRIDREVKADSEKAEKVIGALRRRLGEEAYECLCYAMASCEPDKAEAVYKTIVAGFSMRQGFRVFNKVTDPYVARCFDLKRGVGREIRREMEFLRFRELENGVLLAEIHPKNDVLMYLGPHFSDRLPLENFLIYDRNRGKVIFHEKEKEWYMMDALELDGRAAGRISTGEKYYQELFRMFVKTIAIVGRENEKLQRQLLPLHCRDLMPEFA